MGFLPTLLTTRLRLCPFITEDAPDVERLAGDRAVAANIPVMPHPYPPGAAVAWIATHPGAFEKGRELTLAITSGGERRQLFGAITLHLNGLHAHAELGFWLGREHWGHGYATEASRALVKHAFEDLGLHRVFAHRLVRNEGSGRVLRKIGMVEEGMRRQHVRVFGVFEDVVEYGLLRDEQAR